jgi:hypothetical protein
MVPDCSVTRRVPKVTIVGSSDLDKFFENCYASCSFGWQKINKTVLQKAFFFILWQFYHFSVLVSENLENDPSASRNVFFSVGKGHIGYLKNREFYADFKMQTSPSDNMPPNQVKIIKQKDMGLRTIRNFVEIF